MNICVDTNVLVRAIVADDVRQCQAARSLLMQAQEITVSLPCLCELVWVLRSIKLAKEDISHALRTLLDADNVIMNRSAVEYGIVILDAGGDFADGIMAWEGRTLGAKKFVSFDKKAVALLSQNGHIADLLE